MLVTEAAHGDMPIACSASILLRSPAFQRIFPLTVLLLQCP